MQGRVLAGQLRGESDLLFGRRPDENFHRTWAARTDNPLSPRLDPGRKDVVSRALSEPLIWAKRRRPRRTPLGSGRLLRGLLAEDHGRTSTTAVRADLLRRLGHPDEADAACVAAAGRTTNAAEVAFLRARRATLRA